MNTAGKTQFRLLRTSDREALAQFFTDCHSNESAKFFHPFPLNGEGVEHVLSWEQNLAFIAQMEAEIVGFSMLRGWDEGFEIPSFGIIISPECRGSGIGKAMTEWTIHQAWERSAPSIRLKVYFENTPAIELYRSLGFQSESESAETTTGEQALMTLQRP